VVDEGETLVVSGNSFLVGALREMILSDLNVSGDSHRRSNKAQRTLETPKISYGSYCLAVVRAVTMIK